MLLVYLTFLSFPLALSSIIHMYIQETKGDLGPQLFQVSTKHPLSLQRQSLPTAIRMNCTFFACSLFAKSSNDLIQPELRNEKSSSSFLFSSIACFLRPERHGLVFNSSVYISHPPPLCRTNWTHPLSFYPTYISRIIQQCTSITDMTLCDQVHLHPPFTKKKL